MPYSPTSLPPAFRPVPFVRLPTAMAMHQLPARIAGQGHQVFDHPGGIFPMGSSRFTDAKPRMVAVSPFSLARTPLTAQQYQAFIKPEKAMSPDRHQHPANVSWKQSAAYMVNHNEGLTKASDIASFPTEAEWELADRGPAVNVRQFMENKSLTTADQLVDFLRANGRFLENFVGGALELSALILAGVDHPGFKHLIDGTTSPVHAWRVVGTLSGTLNEDEVWYNKNDTAPVPDKRANGYGFVDMTGNVWKWVADNYDAKASGSLPQIDPLKRPDSLDDNSARVLRGASWCLNFPGFFAAACRGYYHPDYDNDIFGVRLAFPAPQDS